MGRRNARQETESYDSDSDRSTSTAATVDGGGCGASPDAVAKLVDRIEELTEKRAATRKAALEGIRVALTSSVCTDDLRSHIQTMMSECVKLMKKGDVEEAKMAAKCVGLSCITMGTECDTMFEEHREAMRGVISARKNGAIAGLAMELIALMAFTSGQDAMDVMGVMDECWERAVKSNLTTHDILSALSSWVLLCTLLPDRSLTFQMEKWLLRLTPLLHHSDMEVRMVAGEGVAILFDAHYAYAETVGPDDVPELPDTYEVRATVRELIQHCAKSTAKADRVTQRGIFREVEDTMDNQHDITEKLKLRGETVELRGWAERKQMAVLRSVLQEGLQQHLQSNILLREIFGLGPILTVNELSARRSQEDRKLQMAQSAAESKLRTMRRIKQRGVRDQRNHAFLAEE